MLFTFQAVATVFQIANPALAAPARLAVIGVKRLLATVAMQFHEDRFGVAREVSLSFRHGHQSFVQSLRLGSVR